ncbi:FMN reductase [Burkholderia glumae]|nr:FMN reductase [Burkholderia glumae]AJY62353.1 FMN reductase [Burkholderia glumae LMG 2196 = ATCC 33617]MCM2541734.1 FMN reductase [Burkholderia glumae]MCM2547283.1 FMN reductase [Burkholderia glumae]MCQ0034466.1 FMN reductase [Burkholderia glumae]MCQ0039849.1 FMN reductase [Burkholderia glumae]
MRNGYRIVAVSGNTQQPSRTLTLVKTLLDRLAAALPVDTHLVELGTLAPELGSVLSRAHATAAIETDLRSIETADALLVASPVYRASYTGLFKHLFDLVHHEALVDMPVLLAATGGSDRHALVIDHQLRPLFSFFQAHTLPIGVYGTESDFCDYQIASPTLHARIDLAIARAATVIRVRRPELAADDMLRTVVSPDAATAATFTQLG